jgi:hypothetical protein
MKATIAAIMVILGLASIAPAQKETTLTLRPGQQKRAGRDGPRVRFVSVSEDSRCPEKSACVWAGNARVEIVVSDRRGSRKLAMNTTTGNKGDQYGGWAINLVSLTPKEDGRMRQSKYRAVFSIERLTR